MMKKNHSGANRHKVKMISLEISFSLTSYLKEYRDQICQTRQVSSVVNDTLAKPLVFSRLSSTPPTLHSVIFIPERYRCNSKKPQKKTKVSHATVDMLRRGNPTPGVTCPSSSPKEQSSTGVKGVYCNMLSKTKSMMASR